MTYQQIMQNYINAAYKYPPNLADPCHINNNVIFATPYRVPNEIMPPYNPYLTQLQNCNPNPCGDPNNTCDPLGTYPKLGAAVPVGPCVPTNPCIPVTTCGPSVPCGPSFPCNGPVCDTGICCPTDGQTHRRKKRRSKNKKCKDNIKINCENDCLNISTCPPVPCVPVIQCQPPPPSNPCESPWIVGWPWITRSWAGKYSNTYT